MLETICLNTETKRFTDHIPTPQISDYCISGRNIVWVDVTDPTSVDFTELAEEFDFHPLSLQDCRGGHERPKIEGYPGYYFLVVYEAELVGPDDRLELRELNLFLGSNYIVTVHSRPIRAIDNVKRQWRAWIDHSELGVGLPAYLLTDAIVDDYMPLLDILSERVDQLVDDVFGDFRPEIMREIFLVKRQLLYLRRTVAPMRDVINVMLRRELPIIPRQAHPYYQDIFDNLLRVGDMIDTLRETLGSTMEAYLSVSSHRMSTVMKRLTSISTILMSATLVAGIYGMNFENMPELLWRYGYVFALLSMIGIGFAIYLYLKKIKWL